MLPGTPVGDRKGQHGGSGVSRDPAHRAAISSGETVDGLLGVANGQQVEAPGREED